MGTNMEIDPNKLRVRMILKYKNPNNSFSSPLKLIIRKIKTTDHDKYEFNDVDNPDRYMGSLNNTVGLHKYNSV